MTYIPERKYTDEEIAAAEARFDTWSRIPAETRRDLLLWGHPGQNLSEADLLYLARIRADETGPGGAP